MFVTARFLDSSAVLYVLDSQLQPLQSLSLDAPDPAPPQSAASNVQVVLNSVGFVHLFAETRDLERPTVWVLDTPTLAHLDAWQPPTAMVPRTSGNWTDSLLAIDSEDPLYFQAIGADRRTLILTISGKYVTGLDVYAGRVLPSDVSWLSPWAQR